MQVRGDPRPPPRLPQAPPSNQVNRNPNPAYVPSPQVNRNPNPAYLPSGGSGGQAYHPQAAPVQVQHTVHAPPSDVTTSNPGSHTDPYGLAKAQAFKQSSAQYRNAIVDTFLHQPDPQKAAILKGALKIPSLEGHILLNYLRGTNSLIGRNFNRLGGAGTGSKYGLQTAANPYDNPHLLDKAMKGLTSGGIFKSNGTLQGQKSAGGALGSVTPFASGTLGQKMLLNTGKDAINLPAEAFATAGTLGGDVISGKPGKAISDLVTPYKQLLQHPFASVVNHPLDTALMVAAPLHGATRLGAGAVRTAAPDSSLGRAVSTNRQGVRLAGNMTHERPRYSPYPLIKAGQVAVERARYTKSPTGSLVPRSKALQNKLTAFQTSRLVGVNERIRAANRDAAVAQRANAVKAPLPVRVAKAVVNAPKYGKRYSVIPGANVLSLIADGTIRRPATVAADLMKYRQLISSNRPNLDGKLLKEHQATVKQIDAALANKAFLSNPAPAFKAADAYAKDYLPVQNQAHELGHFGQTSAEALDRRTLAHYAISHMNAYYEASPKGLDPKAPPRGLVRDVQHPTGRTTTGVPLSTDAIKRHMAGPEGVGGRQLAFTSDRPKPGSAFYVSSERRPLPQTAKNTYFAYTHGLSDVSHEALLHQHVRMQGVVDAHKAQNRLVDGFVVAKPDGSYWTDARSALHDAPHGYRPVSVSQPFHNQRSLDQALHGTDPQSLEAEAATHGLDLSSRLQDTGTGRWGLIDEAALKRINEHVAQIQSNPAMRTFKTLNNQFRKVALGTSPKHIPGIIQEGLIRDIASGVGLQSWITGRRLVARAKQLDAEKGQQAHIALTGGMQAGATKAMLTHQASDHFAGTNLHPVLKAFEATMKTPGPRQLATAWGAWTKFAINGTKKVIEENNQKAGLGKAALQDFGAIHGPFFKALRLQGAMLDDAAKGLFDPAKQRQMRSEIEKIYGRWTDLTPTGQTAMMISPFGLWWTNSVKWLLRQPADNPIKTGVAAGATVGTQQERQAQGLDMFMKGAVPAYEQGGIPLNGKILSQNYYSPFGVANDPVQTGASLIEPWLQGPLLASGGLSWLFKPLTSPSNPKGRTPANTGERAQAILNSVLSSFIPLYSKAQQVAQGGASAYDSSTLLSPQTKTPGQGVGAGLKKALTPYRLYKNQATAGPGAASAGGIDPATGIPFAGGSSGGVDPATGLPFAGGTSGSSGGNVDPATGIPFAK